MRSQGGPTHEIHLPSHPAILEGANRLGTDLPGQIHLQSAIDGHKMVELANDLRVVGVGHRVHLDHGIIINKVHQAARPHEKAGDHLAAIAGLAGPGNDSPLDEVDHPIGKHFGMDPQVMPIGQRLQRGIGNGADAQLQRRPILDQLPYIPTDYSLRLVGWFSFHVIEGPLPLHRII